MHDDNEPPEGTASAEATSSPSAEPPPVSPPDETAPITATPPDTPTSPMHAPAWPLPPADPAGIGGPMSGPTTAPTTDPFGAAPTSPALDLPAPGTQGAPGGTSLPPMAPPPTPPSSSLSSKRPWVAVAVIAAVVGALVGAGVTALTDNNGGTNNNVTIPDSKDAPGAAVLSGNVSVVALAKKLEPSVVSIDVKSQGSEDQGTGMIISDSGEVITNNHVIELFTQNGNTGSITVTEYGQTKADPATLIGTDATKDVALLKITSATSLPPVTFGDSTKAQVGDYVVAIGNALGLAAGTPTVTQGIISALGRSVTAGGSGTSTETLQNLIQTDAAINPGNSGGPLIDTEGQVIGMNTAVAGTSSDGTSAQNIGFAIPIAQVESLIPELVKGGAAANGGGYLGVDITTMTSALRQQYGFTPTSGAVILTVIAGSPAAKAGLQEGDVIVAIDGKPVTSAETLQNIVQKDKAGQSISVTYYVGNSKRTAQLTLESQAQAQQQQSQSQSNSGVLPFGG